MFYFYFKTDATERLHGYQALHFAVSAPGQNQVGREQERKDGREKQICDEDNDEKQEGDEAKEGIEQRQQHELVKFLLTRGANIHHVDRFNFKRICFTYNRAI